MQTGTQDGIDPVKISEVLATVMQAFSLEERQIFVLHHGERLEPPVVAIVVRCTEQHVLDTLSSIKDRVRKVLRPELAEAR